jgi:biotin transport system ATP-binding protein
LLSITNVTLMRGSTAVFAGLNLQLSEPRIGLIGDNGAGKTSLFRLACGLDAPHEGSVTVQGMDAFRINAHHPNTVGMMFQNPDDQIIFPTVQEELALSLTSHAGMDRRAAQAQAREFLASRGLQDWAERAISSLSHGQRQHVCWLAILLSAPALILLDEPFASLDLPSQSLLHQDIARAPQQVIASTHVLDHLQAFDRVIWLDKGRVRADGEPSVVCREYRADVASRARLRSGAPA